MRVDKLGNRAVTYGIATCICFCKLGRRAEVASRRWYVPLVAGAVIRFDGQITVVDPRNMHSPCYACIFPPEVDFEEVSCSTMGVFAPLVGVVGAVQAAEALKLICGIGTSLAGRLLMLDGRSMDWSTMQVQRSPACSVCA